MTETTRAAQLEQQQLTGAGWFFWIAALSLLNSALNLIGGGWGFAVGLGLTQFMDSIALGLSEELGGAVKLTVFGFDLIVASAVVAFGVLARRRHLWAYWVGMFLYALDGSLFLVVGDWTSIAFHAFMLFGLWNGMRACDALRTAAVERETATQRAAA